MHTHDTRQGKLFPFVSQGPPPLTWYEGVTLNDLGIIILTCGWITKDADQRGKVERHIEGAFGSRHTTTNHGSQLRSRCWFYGGRKTGGPGEKPSKHGRDQLYDNSTHMSSKFFWGSTRDYNQVVTHPAITPVRPGLTSALSGERQRVKSMR